MKKILFVAAVAMLTTSLSVAPTVSAEAQSTKLVTKSITAADTVVFTSVPSKIKSFTYAYTKASGTAAGIVYLEGSNISGQWDVIDTLTLSNVTTIQKKTTVVTATNYVNYRYRNTNTSSAPGAVKAIWLRRADE